MNTPDNSTPDGLLSIGEAARILGISVDTLRKYADAGRVPVTRTLGGQRRFPAASLRDFIDRKSVV